MLLNRLYKKRPSTIITLHQPLLPVNPIGLIIKLLNLIQVPLLLEIHHPEEVVVHEREFASLVLGFFGLLIGELLEALRVVDF